MKGLTDSSQDIKVKVREGHKFMFEEKPVCDITFILCTTDGSEVKVPAHKYPLITGSPVFKAMFCGPMATNTGEIRIEDIGPDAFHEILR